MAGYNNYSKSNNAIAAEGENKYPASRVASILKVSTEAVKSLMSVDSWHHTSKHYNKTHYYDIDVFFSPECYDEEVVKAFDVLVKQMKEYKADTKQAVYIGCEVDYLEWSGSRAHPKCEQVGYIDCVVEIKGQTAYITTKKGTKITKRLTTKGLSIKCQGVRI